MYVAFEPSREVLDALADYKLSLERLTKRRPTVAASELHCQTCYERLIKALEDERVKAPLQKIFQNVKQGDFEIIANDSANLATEACLLSKAEKISQDSSKQIIFRVIEHLRNNTNHQFDAVEMMIAQILAFHGLYMQKFRESRDLERVAKKKKRREIFVNAGYLCSGIAIVTTNALAIVSGPLAAGSFSLGGGAIFKGAFDLARVV